MELRAFAPLIGRTALGSPPAWVLLLAAGLSGPAQWLYETRAPIQDPSGSGGWLWTQLLLTLAAGWALRVHAGAHQLQRPLTDLARWGVGGLSVLLATSSVAAIAWSSLALWTQPPSGLVLCWAVVKLVLLASVLMRLLNPAKAVWLLLALVWGAPQLGVAALTTALGLPLGSPTPLEGAYLAGMLLIAWAVKAPRTDQLETR